MTHTKSNSIIAKITCSLLVLAVIVGLTQVFGSNYANEYTFDATLAMNELGQIEHLINSTDSVSNASVDFLLTNN